MLKEKHHHHDHECDRGHGCDHDQGFSSGWSMKTIFSYLILVIPLLTGKGVLDMGSYGDTEMPVIKVTSWKKMNAPADPCVYP